MLILQSDIARALVYHAKSEYPRECCGILLGECSNGRKTVIKLIPTENAASGTGQFCIDPLAILKAEQEPLEILGFYHSHPDCGAIPSEEDVLHMIEGYSYLIISTRNGECSEMRSYLILLQASSEIKEETIIEEI